MKVGDLVKIKYDGVVALITEIEPIPCLHAEWQASTCACRWYSLLDQPVTFRASQIEVVSASR